MLGEFISLILSHWKLLTLYHLFYSLLKFQYLLGIIKLAHLVTHWMACNHHLVCLPPHILVHFHIFILRPLNLHLDLHFHIFLSLYSIRLPDLLHCNPCFCLQCIHITQLKSSNYHIWIPLCYWILEMRLCCKWPFPQCV